MATETSELVARLRREEDAGWTPGVSLMFSEAADRIEALAAENERLREALNGMVEQYAARTFGGTLVSGSEQYPWVAKALAALTPKP